MLEKQNEQDQYNINFLMFLREHMKEILTAHILSQQAQEFEKKVSVVEPAEPPTLNELLAELSDSNKAALEKRSECIVDALLIAVNRANQDKKVTATGALHTAFTLGLADSIAAVKLLNEATERTLLAQANRDPFVQSGDIKQPPVKEKMALLTEFCKNLKQLSKSDDPKDAIIGFTNNPNNLNIIAFLVNTGRDNPVLCMHVLENAINNKIALLSPTPTTKLDLSEAARKSPEECIKQVSPNIGTTPEAAAKMAKDVVGKFSAKITTEKENLPTRGNNAQR